MTRRVTPLPPVAVTPDGRLVLNLDSNAANADWIRAARLKRRAEAGDEQAAAELRELFETPVYRVEQDDPE